MPNATLWESICRLSGEDGSALIPLDEAINGSAVPAEVAAVEIKRMVQDGLLEEDGDAIRLTERGRQARSELYRDPTLT